MDKFSKGGLMDHCSNEIHNKPHSNRKLKTADSSKLSKNPQTYFFKKHL